MKRLRPAVRHLAAIAWMLGIFVLLSAPRAVAQPRWGRPTQPRAGACFYRNANFRGDYFCTNANEDIPVMPADMNDQISSIRTFGNAEVIIFQNVRFSGRSERFDGDIRNLADEGWNDRLSSVRVRSSFRDGSNDRGGRDDRRGDRDGDRGDDRRDGMDADRIVRRAYQDILDREPDAAGLRLYRSHIIDDGWSEQRVRETLRNSPEYRLKNTMTRERAEEIVRRAYLSVLQREPDAGSRGYVDRVLRDKWTEQDVARELRNSDEYRLKNRR